MGKGVTNEAMPELMEAFGSKKIIVTHMFSTYWGWRISTLHLSLANLTPFNFDTS